MNLRLISVSDCTHIGNAADVAGGRILPAPITRWASDEWDARAFSTDRLAVLPAGWTVGRDVSGERAAIVAALNEYGEQADVVETLAAIA